jgi:rhodanese-related sulfurtransferase
LLDVREPHEFEFCSLAGSINVPLGDLQARIRELNPDDPTVCICHHGIRSAHAAAALGRLGFSHLRNLSGGVERWALDVDRELPRY